MPNVAIAVIDALLEDVSIDDKDRRPRETGPDNAAIEIYWDGAWYEMKVDFVRIEERDDPSDPYER